MYYKLAKIDETLRTRIVSGGLSLILLVTGFGLGKLDSKRNNNSTIDEDNYLEDYIEKREELEKEIASLSEEKEKLEDVVYYNIENLIVIEYPNVDNESELYILRTYQNYSGLEAYDFQTKIYVHTTDSRYYGDSDHAGCIFVSEYQPLFNYLTEEDKELLTKNDGQFTNLELDDILTRIRFEYHQQKEKESYTRSLIK